MNTTINLDSKRDEYTKPSLKSFSEIKLNNIRFSQTFDVTGAISNNFDNPNFDEPICSDKDAVVKIQFLSTETYDGFDETEFDLTSDTTWTDIVSLWEDFCKENCITFDYIVVSVSLNVA